ncbi:hypothetical protein FB45DRAFT_426900 [Roridomyces roridus]|uniref:Uncharacterized protein n=1 Tax=Roridomyces roridus TaxID=1738132 RepID=A0AAD7C5W2_9AGAR|nr:hypothetical protein FB45DRAFT_426900 [Roridomyces roridus]
MLCCFFNRKNIGLQDQNEMHAAGHVESHGGGSHKDDIPPFVLKPILAMSLISPTQDTTTLCYLILALQTLNLLLLLLLLILLMRRCVPGLGRVDPEGSGSTIHPPPTVLGFRRKAIPHDMLHMENNMAVWGDRWVPASEATPFVDEPQLGEIDVNGVYTPSPSAYDGSTPPLSPDSTSSSALAEKERNSLHFGGVDALDLALLPPFTDANVVSHTQSPATAAAPSFAANDFSDALVPLDVYPASDFAYPVAFADELPSYTPVDNGSTFYNGSSYSSPFHNPPDFFTASGSGSGYSSSAPTPFPPIPDMWSYSPVYDHGSAEYLHPSPQPEYDPVPIYSEPEYSAHNVLAYSQESDGYAAAAAGLFNDNVPYMPGQFPTQ